MNNNYMAPVQPAKGVTHSVFLKSPRSPPPDLEVNTDQIEFRKKYMHSNTCVSASSCSVNDCMFIRDLKENPMAGPLIQLMHLI